MQNFQIQSFDYDRNADQIFRKDGYKGEPFDRIRFYLKFEHITLTYTLRVTAHYINQFTMEIGYVGDGLEWDFNFNNKADYDEFRKCMVEQCEAITGRKLQWIGERSEDDPQPTLTSLILSPAEILLLKLRKKYSWKFFLN